MMLTFTPNKQFKALLTLIFILSFSLFAQVQKETYKILGISVVGNKSADATTIIANTGLRINDELVIPSDQINNAIKRLWNLGIFEDVQLLIDKKIDNGIFLLIKVSEYPRLEKLVFEGYDELSEDKLNKMVSIVRGQTLKPNEISRTIIKIKKAYEEEGYLNAKIIPEYFRFFQADTNDNEVTVTWRNEKDLSKEYKTDFKLGVNSSMNNVAKMKDRVIVIMKIDEGKEVIIRNIYFKGNLAFEDSKLKSQFDETSEKRWWKFWSWPKFKRDKFEKDKELLTKFYRKNGYRDFTVLKDSIVIYNNNQDLDLYVYIYEGKQFKIRNIIWEGSKVYPEDELNARLDMQKGDVFDYEKFEQNLRFNEKQSDVSSLYQDNGYLTAQIEPKEIKVAEDSVDIEIKINEGNRFKIGKVEIQGNDKTKDKVIRRELYTIPGSYFSRSFIMRSIQQLSNLQYFNVEQLYKSGVDYKPANDSTVNLIYKVEEKSSDYLNASVGYSGAFGFSGSVGFTLTNFSITEPFKMGGGQILNFNWQFGVGNYYRTFSLGFTEPWFLDTPTSVGFDLSDTRQRYVYDLRQSGITLRAGRRLTWPDDYFYIQGILRFQYNDVIDGQNIYREGLTRQYTVGFGITRTDIDNPIFPSRGSKFALNTELSGGPLLPGNVDYYKIDFKTEWYKALFNTNKIVLYTSSELGYIGELIPNTPIQPFEYYYMGGSGLIIATTPLRGYEDRSLGLRDIKSNNIIGSKVQAKFTTELRFALSMEPIPIYLLAFAEAGNVYPNIKQTNFYDLKRSVGVGARILLNPIGLIGFDYGYGFDRMSVDGKSPQWMFHFQFGKGF
ncbi:outer membrane protein assembly factor BamA [Stygiobacter electus]|uniref:Outer membrane protein assembly factor BamA n=1 Tax=Stygiobacter electus TaxID=3032292 RepID=A0AAE3NY31_9BACT|nr:outer membrane protein assembly factor BamA [Stygiobacter electus]MDF1610715.1 outer membrane protein assembly factor BamA [Stygiobacter electus]